MASNSIVQLVRKQLADDTTKFCCIWNLPVGACRSDAARHEWHRNPRIRTLCLRPPSAGTCSTRGKGPLRDTEAITRSARGRDREEGESNGTTWKLAADVVEGGGGAPGVGVLRGARGGVLPKAVREPFRVLLAREDDRRSLRCRVIPVPAHVRHVCSLDLWVFRETHDCNRIMDVSVSTHSHFRL